MDSNGYTSQLEITKRANKRNKGNNRVICEEASYEVLFFNKASIKLATIKERSGFLGQEVGLSGESPGC